MTTTRSPLATAKAVRALRNDPLSWWGNGPYEHHRNDYSVEAFVRAVRLRLPEAVELFPEAVLVAAASEPCRWCGVMAEEGCPSYDEANRELLGAPCAACSDKLRNCAVERIHGDSGSEVARARAEGRTMTALEAYRCAASAHDRAAMARLGITASSFPGHRHPAELEREQAFARAAHERRQAVVQEAERRVDSRRMQRALDSKSEELVIQEYRR